MFATGTRVTVHDYSGEDYVGTVSLHGTRYDGRILYRITDHYGTTRAVLGERIIPVPTPEPIEPNRYALLHTLPAK